MNANRYGLRYLQEKLKDLNHELQRKKLESVYMQFQEQVDQGKTDLIQIRDEEWEVLLPAEKEQRLFHYVYGRRREYLEMSKAAEESVKTGRLREWLENPWVRIALTGVTVTDMTVTLLQIAQSHGLFFREDEHQDYLD